MYNEFSMTFSRSDQRRTVFKLPFRLQLVLDVFTEKLILKNGKVAILQMDFCCQQCSVISNLDYKIPKIYMTVS